MLRSDLCDYSDAYCFIKGAINLVTNLNGNMPRIDAGVKIIHHLGHA